MKVVTVTEETKMRMVKLYGNENENDLPHFRPFLKNTVISQYSTVDNYQSQAGHEPTTPSLALPES